jgi:hypothetical protein
MEHTITLGDVLFASGLVIGVIAVLAVLIWFLKAYARGMSR